MQETRTYTIRNVDQKPKTLIIEHSQRAEYKLLNQKPAETTTNAYRFEVKLAAGAAETFPVVEERVYDQTYSVTNLTPDVLLTYIRNRDLNAAARNLVTLAIERDGSDNISVQLIRVRDVERMGMYRGRPYKLY